jgi:hypothetical protein
MTVRIFSAAELAADGRSGKPQTRVDATKAHMGAIKHPCVASVVGARYFDTV